jgi:transcription initiation factor IIF auxiliary subunit
MTKAKRDDAWVKICEEIQKPRVLKAPEGAEEISYEHVALVHSSWRYPKQDAEFGRPIWAFHLVVVAASEVLDRIEAVEYTLHPTYGDRQRQLVNERMSKFALKELAWGESIVRAIITIRNQQTLIKLNRYINLTETGPRL